MTIRRALILTSLATGDVDADPRASDDVLPSVDTLAWLAPTLERVIIVAGSSASVVPAGELGPALDAQAVERLSVLRRRASTIAPDVEVHSVGELALPGLVDLALSFDADIIVVGRPDAQIAPLARELATRIGLPVLWPAGVTAAHADRRTVRCAALSRTALTTMGSFLRAHARDTWDVTVLSSEVPESRGALDSLLRAMGIAATVEVAKPGLRTLRAWLFQPAVADRADLLVLTRMPSALLSGLPWSAPVLLLPGNVRDDVQSGELDVADLVAINGVTRARVARTHRLGAAGAPSPLPDELLAVVWEGAVVEKRLSSPIGEIVLQLADAVTALGLVRVSGDEPTHEVPIPEMAVAVLRPSATPIVLIDSELPRDRLAALRDELASGAPHALIAVRLRPTRSVAAIRATLREAGLPATVIDARAVLDEGAALDVSAANDHVRLERVARALVAGGFDVRAAWSRNASNGSSGDEKVDVFRPKSGPRAIFAGNRIELETDNTKARGWLLEAIATARASVAIQVYMAADDDVGQEVEQELARAAERGVSVRVLVDSLHAFYGSFGPDNPLLTRLAQRPGVELRAWRPVQAPSLEGLKRRNHRKICIADGQLALIGGRNLSHEYYVGFDEVALSRDTPWRVVPWLDAGCRITGPAVAEIARVFGRSWVEAGGSPLPISEPAPSFDQTLEIVTHEGLADARTLETYRDLIENSKHHIYVVNGFPLALELQHALLAAVLRGVRVRGLIGHLTPQFSGGAFEGTFAQTRTLATELVHSRWDPLVEAGAELYVFAVPSRPDWEKDVGAVQPHVHAKVMSVDGKRCMVGSANLDVTSAYWESEIAVLVDDARATTSFEAHLDTLMASSTRCDSADPLWQERARRRAWMRHWPGVLSA